MSCTRTLDCDCGCCSGIGVQTPQPRGYALGFASVPPGLASIPYRVGTWASFKQSMVARLSSADYPALTALKTRDDDDFTVAFLDAAATMLDVLSFYQERLANEGYLRTASQLRSLTELSRLIAYQPSPAVSASTYVAFSLKSAPGQAPDPSSPAIVIPQGTQVQSVPPQGQTAQTFETAGDIQAKADWSALPVQTSAPWVPPAGPNNNYPNSLYLSGTATQLQIGNSLLILGVNRETWTTSSALPPSGQWQLVIVDHVQADPKRELTYVHWTWSWTPPASSSATASVWVSHGRPVRMRSVPPSSIPTSPWTAAKVFAFRQKAKLFGHNAPRPDLFILPQTIPQSASTTFTTSTTTSATSPGAPPTTTTTITPPPTPSTSLPNLITITPGSNSTNYTCNWNNYFIQSSSQIDLDSVYSKVVQSSWFALVCGNTIQLYNATSVQTISRADFAISGKVTELVPDYQSDSNLTPALTPIPANPPAYDLRKTEVWLQSEQLAVADQPLNYPLYGTVLDLQDLRPDVAGLQVVALFGKRQKIAVATGVTGLWFLPDDLTPSIPLNPGDVFALTDPSPLPLAPDGSIQDWRLFPSTSMVTLYVEDANERTGTISGDANKRTGAALDQFVLTPSLDSDPNVSEYALVSYVIGTPAPYAHTQIQLSSSLANCYDRWATTVNLNVALVTHGQSVSELMGSGNASTPNQSFGLKQSPLTYVQAPTPTGRQSTLQVQANGVAWTEVPSLYDQSPNAQVFVTLNQSDRTTDVLFGDGVEGALLPTGQGNIQANYRIGSGSQGNVAANTLTTLIDRPLGVNGVTNPQSATGGQDAQSVTHIRANAPQSVLTLGRAVSLVDYQNYASAFAGIAKAYAVWIPSGPGQGVFLTVAGVNGVALTPSNPTLNNLLASLRNFGNPQIPIAIQSFVETLFGLSANLQYDPAYDQPTVQAQVLATLSQAYSFAQRSFGQGVSVDEIAAIIQSVPGVVAVNVLQIDVVASSAAGDLAGAANGFSVAAWNRWIAQTVTVPRSPPSSTGAISAFLPAANPGTPPFPAELLVLSPDPSSVTLGLMS
jgi:Baseplate J-like protein